MKAIKLILLILLVLILLIISIGVMLLLLETWHKWQHGYYTSAIPSRPNIIAPSPRKNITAACFTQGGTVNTPACKAACMNHAESTANSGLSIMIPSECSNYAHAYHRAYKKKKGIR